MSAESFLDFNGEDRPQMRQKLQLIQGGAAQVEEPRILFGEKVIIPKEYEEEWALVNKELSLAIELRDTAERQYEAVRMARLALMATGTPNPSKDGSDGLETLQDELSDAGQRLQRAIASRIDLNARMRQG